MRLVATLCARNEDWVLGLSARAALMWCDHVVLFNHASTDGTGDVAARVAAEHPGKVTYLSDDDPTWKEMSHRQRMLEIARSVGATHVAIVDADEVLSGNLIDGIRRFVERTPPDAILQLPWAGLARSIDRYYVDGVWGWNSFVSTSFADKPGYHWKTTNGYDFHHRHPHGMGEPPAAYRPVKAAAGGLMHLQFVSERRLRAKQALYKMVEVIRWPDRTSVDDINQKYNKAVYGGGATADVDEGWWLPYSHLMQYLQLDETQEPWQERQCHEYWNEYGAQKFRGLDLFGVCG